MSLSLRNLDDGGRPYHITRGVKYARIPMKPDIPVDVDHCWKRLITLANEAQTDPQHATTGIVRSLMAHGNQVHIDQLRNMVTRELAVQHGARVPLNTVRLQSRWLDILTTARNTLGRENV